ncbi:hypothetical protein NEMIN01_1300 [Nematocida minor]|uniref:uncharacterized protein n=1 Tax=Nematocida minor TaxID=1912983 RepID=UPI00221E4B12|nr:uncharacterized protein NEMIN01_1300 [Nematocida minor]KAI5190967.1 hypothetical protein NEMIN01_1300 [Nematocida minor]
MSIAEQLKKVREQCTTEKRKVVLFNEWREDPDVLFYTRVEEAVELFSIYHEKFYEKTQKYFEYFADSRSKDSRRDRLTEKENSSLSKRMKMFLEELAPYSHHEHTQIILEWLIRRYRIDKYEFDHLVVCTLRVPALQEILYLSVKSSLEKKNLAHDLLACRSIAVHIGRVLAKSIALNSILLKPLSSISEENDTVNFVVFLEAVSCSLFESEKVQEEIIGQWIDSVMQCRDRLVKEKSTDLIVKPLESTLFQISRSHDLLDEIKDRIESFREKPTEIQPEEVAEVSHRFSTLYAHFKRTGAAEDIISEYPEEFLYQIITEKEEISNWLELVGEIIFNNLISDESLVALFQDKPWLIGFASTDSRWGKLVKKQPAISILASLEEKKEGEIFSKKFLKQFYQLLPNTYLEKWIFKKIDTTANLKTVLSVFLPVLSNGTLASEILKATAWESACLFLQETTVPIFIQNIDKALFIDSFLQYVDIASKYSDYTPLKMELSPEEKQHLLAISKKKWEKKKASMTELLFIIHLFSDLGASTESLLAMKKSIVRLSETERKRCIKAILEILSTREDKILGSELMSLLETLDTFDIDTTVSLLAYKSAMSLDLMEFGTIITNSITVPGTVEAKMMNVLLKDNFDLVESVFEKYFGTLSSESILAVIATSHVAVLLSGLAKVFNSLEDGIKIKIIQEAIEQNKNGNPLLFEALCAHSTPGMLLKSLPEGNQYAVALLLDSVVNMLDSQSEISPSADSNENMEVGSLLLNALVIARKMGIYEPSLLNWEKSILPMKGVPALLSDKLKKTPSLIVKGIISRYLKKNLPATDLLLAFIKAGISDQSALLNVLKYNPSSKSKVLLFRSLLMKKTLKNSLPIILAILKDKKSSLIRYYIQSRLKYIVKIVLKESTENPNIVSSILGNLVKREKNIMHPYTSDILGLIKKTKKKGLIAPLTKIDIRYVMQEVKTRQDIIILREYVRSKLEKLETEEINSLVAFYIEHIEEHAASKGLVEVFPAVENKSSVWPTILKKCNGFSVLFIHILLRISKDDQKGDCLASLSCVYSRLEELLISSLEANENIAIIEIMRRFFLHQKDTLIDTAKITALSVKSVSNSKQMPLLIASLFYSQSINKPSDAEEINHVVLAEIVKAEGARKAALFTTLRRMYKKAPEFIGRILGQSAPYFAILLESKDAETRSKAESLMALIKTESGENPYRFL